MSLTVVQKKRVHMLSVYHRGFYDKKWTCCGKKKLWDKGCIPTGNLPSAYEGNRLLNGICYCGLDICLFNALAESGALYDEECLSNTSGSTLKINAAFSESLSSSSTLKAQDMLQSFSSGDSAQQ